MNKKVAALGALLLLCCGCGKTIPTLSNGEEAVVTLDGDQKISVNDLYTNVKDNFALQSLITMIDKNILERKYADKIEEAEKTAKDTVDSIKKTYGDETDTMIQYYTGYNTAEAYQEYLYIAALQDYAIDDYAKSKITEKEIQKYYDEKIYGDIAINHILITPEVTDSMTDDEKNAKEQEAKDKVQEIIDKLKKAENVEEEFKKLVQEYSMDEATKGNDGSLGYVNEGTLSSSYDEILNAAKNLKNKEFSKEVITTSMGYHVIFKMDQKEKPTFDEIKDTIITTLADDLKTSDSTLRIVALQELRKEYNMTIVDSELQKQYANYIQNSLAQAQKSSSSN